MIVLSQVSRWCCGLTVIGVLISVSESQTQLAPSGDVVVCPGSVVMLTCNVSRSLLVWRMASPQMKLPLTLFLHSNFSRLGIPMPFAGESMLGVNVTAVALSNTSLSSSLSVDTSNYSRNLGPFLFQITCNQEGASIIGLGKLPI